jgi:manganese/zinc/iron transport system ATP- binding protein
MIRHTEHPAVEVHDLTVTYNRKPVLWDIDFTLPSGALTGVIGPNGAGKSTLLKAIMGLVPAGSGYVHIFGKPLDEVRHRVSYVPQRGSVDWDFPVSVLDVVLMGRYNDIGPFRFTRRADREMAMKCLRRVDIEHLADRQIAQLSGGQQQRVFLARALAQNADLYILDEPFAGVDAATESAIIALLREMAAQGKTLVVVHHDLSSAASYFDWIVLLNTRLIACAPAREAFRPELLQETYGGKLNLLTEIGEILEKQRFPVRETKP